MGTVEINDNRLVIASHIITYGGAANETITEDIRDEIETMWNEPHGSVHLNNSVHYIVFKITAEHRPTIDPLTIYQNLDPRNNYFRIEEYAFGNISFVDGLGCNSGYFKLENLYKGSTTAAHEYGHTLGLDHPTDIDLRGKGVPGIMYPRGTLVDPIYQYDPLVPAGTKGGTLYPIHRKVMQLDIDHLKIHRLRFQSRKSVLGEFSNVWHDSHPII